MTLSLMEPVKKCKMQKINIPDVMCEEEKEERCFMLPGLEDDDAEIEKCVAELGDPRCSSKSLKLPARTCVSEVDHNDYIKRHRH